MFASGAAAAAQRTGLAAGPHIAALLRRFHRDRSGNVAMLFSLLLIPLVALIGLAVDFGHVYKVTSHTQAALDAAALAAGRAAQLNPTNTVAQASAAATAYFNQAKPTDVVSSTLQFSPNSSNTQFTVTATSWVKTPFLSVLNSLFHRNVDAGAPIGCSTNGFGCVVTTATATSALCPSVACTSTGTQGATKDVEVALMLDITGSMCTPCTKIQAVQSSAKDLIDILAPDSQTGAYVRVALAPFAEAVNVGKTLAPLVRGTVTSNTQNGSGSNAPEDFTTTSVLNDVTKQPTKKWIKYKKASGSGNNTWLISSKCVTERIGNDAYTDAAPAGTSTYVGKGYFGASQSSSSPQQDDTSCAVANYTDDETNSIQPLTTDSTMLKRRIDKLTTGGSTAGHLGTAWAWYLLSPNWNGVLQQAFPASYAAGSYSSTVDPRTPPNQAKVGTLRKVAVLMTDGDYNINYCKGVEAKNSDQSPDINCNSENGKSLAQATSLCSGMKNAKIEVFTIGFQVSSASKTFLTNCATAADHFYDATTEAALQMAYRDIALKIATLRLTN
jgi:Flp pilus assembly protein TadG